MRLQALTGALVVSLTASGLALGATSVGARTKPDLVVGSLSNPPEVLFLGRSFTVSDRTRNIGQATARATVTRYYLSSSGEETVVGRRSVMPLKPRRSSSGSATAKVPVSLDVGSYSLIACADGAHVAKEANERNNCRTAATKVVVKKPPPPV